MYASLSWVFSIRTDLSAFVKGDFNKLFPVLKIILKPVITNNSNTTVIQFMEKGYSVQQINCFREDQEESCSKLFAFLKLLILPINV